MQAYEEECMAFQLIMLLPSCGDTMVLVNVWYQTCSMCPYIYIYTHRDPDDGNC